VAMLSFSNFGSVDHRLAKKVRQAAEIARRQAPELALDGEMQLLTARTAPCGISIFPLLS